MILEKNQRITNYFQVIKNTVKQLKTLRQVKNQEEWVFNIYHYSALTQLTLKFNIKLTQICKTEILNVFIAKLFTIRRNERKN